MSTPQQICTFTLAGMQLGIDVLLVQEVITEQRMTRVPKAPPAVSGLINLRGQIVTAIDLRERFGLPPFCKEEDEGEPINVVVRTPEGPVSLLVDQIGDVIEVQDGWHEMLPANVDASRRRIISGVYKLDDQLLLLVDVSRAVDLREAGIRAAEPISRHFSRA